MRGRAGIYDCCAGRDVDAWRAHLVVGSGRPPSVVVVGSDGGAVMQRNCRPPADVAARCAVIYKDVFSGDELLTDAFDITTIDDFFYEVDGKMIAVGGEEIDFGGNASAEGGGDDVEDEVQKVCNVVHSGRFQETSFGKKDYVACYKAFMKVRLPAVG